MPKNTRLDFLDGIRGLAILMVVTLHYFVQIYDVPRSIFYNHQTPLRHLDFGVQLFFVISGYVIFMTLDKTPGFFSFMARRWIRLFPAMLAATFIIAVAAHFLSYRPGGIPRLIDLVPGLSFLGANIISTLSRIQTDGLERGFWSIYVEFRFYLLFGIFYYTLGKYKAFYAMTALSAILLGLIQLATAMGAVDGERAQGLFGKMLIGHYLPWFLLGMYIYLYAFQSRFLILLLIIVNALAYSIYSRGALAMSAAIPLLMYGAFRVPAVQALFRQRVLLFFGFISYPLYLLNDSLGRGVIRGLYADFSTRVPFEVLPFVALPLVVLPAWLIAKYIEPVSQKYLKQWLFSDVPVKLVPAPMKES